MRRRTRREAFRDAALGSAAIASAVTLLDLPLAARAAAPTRLPDPIVITYGNWEVFKSQADMHRKIVSLFNSSQKTVRVEYSGVAMQKMAIELATGTAPNIVNWYQVDPFGPEGVLRPLDGFIQTDNELLRTIVNREALQQYVVKGKTYAFPSAIYNDQGVYCNEDMCTAAGVKLPATGPFSLDQFQTAISKLLIWSHKRKNTWPIAPFFPSEYIAVAQGGPLTFSPEGNAYNVGNPIIRSSYQWQFDYAFVRGASPPSAAVSSLGGTGGSVTMFESANIGMMMVDEYPISPLLASKPPFKWRVVPGIRDKRYPVHVGIYPLSITNTCKDPEAAYKYLHFVATDRTANFIKLDTGYGMPDRKDVAEKATGPMGAFFYELTHADYSYTAPPPLNSINQFNTNVANPEWQAVETHKTSLPAAIKYLLAQWKNPKYSVPS
jgi:maltose-binding protein MalE